MSTNVTPTLWAKDPQKNEYVGTFITIKMRHPGKNPISGHTLDYERRFSGKITKIASQPFIDPFTITGLK